ACGPMPPTRERRGRRSIRAFQTGGSVGAGVEGRALGCQVDRLGELLVIGLGCRDLGGLTGGDLADELARGAADEAETCVLLEARAGVGDVEVAHRELSDAVHRT